MENKSENRVPNPLVQQAVLPPQFFVQAPAFPRFNCPTDANILRGAAISTGVVNFTVAQAPTSQVQTTSTGALAASMPNNVTAAALPAGFISQAHLEEARKLHEHLQCAVPGQLIATPVATMLNPTQVLAQATPFIQAQPENLNVKSVENDSNNTVQTSQAKNEIPKQVNIIQPCYTGPVFPGNIEMMQAQQQLQQQAQQQQQAAQQQATQQAQILLATKDNKGTPTTVLNATTVQNTTSGTAVQPQSDVTAEDIKTEKLLVQCQQQQQREPQQLKTEGGAAIMPQCALSAFTTVAMVPGVAPAVFPGQQPVTTAVVTTAAPVTTQVSSTAVTGTTTTTTTPKKKKVPTATLR